MRKLLLYPALLLLCCSLWAQTPGGTGAFLTATALFAEGDHASAKELLLVLHEQDPADDAVNYYLGLCELALQELDPNSVISFPCSRISATRSAPANWWRSS